MVVFYIDCCVDCANDNVWLSRRKERESREKLAPVTPQEESGVLSKAITISTRYTFALALACTLKYVH